MSESKRKRLFPLDALRGLIIVFMALDHANYFIAQKHSPGEHWGGAFPSYDSALPFLTRLVTHFSAPGFFFLMGAGMLLFAESRRKQGWSTPRILSHFWIRASVLIAVQLLLVNRIWEAGPQFFPQIYIGVLIALGGCMLIGSLFLRLPPVALTLLALGLLVGTEWLHPSPDMWGRLTADVPNLVLLRSGGDGFLWSNYPILPWLELVIFGMLFAHWLRTDESSAYQKGLWGGLGLLIIFALLRSADGFGNIRPRAGDTWIDFLNVVKYPPSLVFTAMTLGINLIFLWGFSKAGDIGRKLAQPLTVFGREPFFVYITHLALYMIAGRLFIPDGTSIPAMLPFWILGLLVLYPLTLAYGKFKKQQAGDSPWRYL